MPQAHITNAVLMLKNGLFRLFLGAWDLVLARKYGLAHIFKASP
jgi:hypothetical protein